MQNNTSAPAFTCASCANTNLSKTSSTTNLSSLQSPFLQSFTIPRPRRTRGRPRFIANLSASSEEEPTDITAPPITSNSTGGWNGKHLRPSDVRKRKSLNRALVTSVPLNLNGKFALPSVSSLSRYTNDLRPKLDYLEPDARNTVLSALEVANVAHKGQMRKSGEPFIIHPIAVAAILADMKMDRDCIIAGLLHDTVEDTPVTLEELETLFGRDVRKIVEGETKFSKLAKKVQRDKAQRSEQETTTTTEKPALFSDKSKSSLPTSNATSSSTAELTDAIKEKSPPPSVPPFQREREKREEEQQKQADNLRAMFLAMTEDVRVIIVKLADRLHNMRTLGHMSADKQKKTAKETLEFFAPLAHRLGMRRIKSELEELSFMYLHPEEYHQLKYEVETMLRRANLDYYLKEAEELIKDVLEQDRILYNMIRSVEVFGTTKELYSIYRRMLDGENLASMLDIATMRVVLDLDPGVDSNQACYHVLGRIHAMWKPLPKRMKEYIACPKPNGYQSLHTTVLLGQKFDFLAMEIQIRTKQMHQIAEEGIAAELFQSESATNSLTLSQEEEDDSPITADAEWRRRTKGWLISIREYIEEFSSSRDLVDAVRRDLLGNRVFIFTPKGRIVDLPKDSTPIDVAYRIHSDVGHNMIGAKVNGRMVNLDYKLQNADVVKIIGSSSATGPSSEWTRYAKTRTARQKIRQFLRARDRDNTMDKGRRILEEEARSLLEPLPSEAALTDILPRLSAVVSAATGMKNVNTVEDLYVAIGKGSEDQTEFPLERTVLSLLRDRRHTVLSQAASGNLQSPKQMAMAKRVWGGKAAKRQGSIDDEEVLLSPCCHPIRGDEILGIRFTYDNRTVLSIHRVRCDHMKEELKKRPATGKVVNVRWAQKLHKGDEQTAVDNIDGYPAGKMQTGKTSPPGLVDSSKSPLPVRLVLIARDCDGLLSYTSGVLASMGTSIRRSVTVTDPDTLVATLAFEVLVNDTHQLECILERIEACDEVQSVRRLAPNENEEYFPMPLGRASRGPHTDEHGDPDTWRLLKYGHPISSTELEVDEFNVNTEDDQC